MASILSHGPRPLISAVKSPAEVLFTREGDTAFHLQYCHVLLPLDFAMILAILTQVEQAHGKWHNLTQNYPQPANGSYGKDPTWFLDNPKFFWPQTYESLHNHHRILILKDRIKNARAIFTPIDKVLDEYIKTYPEEARDFVQNDRSHTNSWQNKHTHMPPHATSLLARAERAIQFIIAGAIALFGIIAITFSSLYTATEISKLHSSLRINDHSHAYREDQLGHGEQAILRLFQKTMRLYGHSQTSYREAYATTILLDAVEKRLDMFDDAISAGLMGRVSASLFLQVDLPRTAAEVERRARTTGMMPLAAHASDWIQFEATLIATNKGFDIVLHVPMVDRSSIMHIYRFHPLPIPLEHGLHLAIDTAPYTHVAVDKENFFFRAFTLAELNACRSIGLFRLCDLNAAVRSVLGAVNGDDIKKGFIDSELCLHALHDMRFDIAALVCRANIGHARSTVRQIGPTTFASYSPKPEKGKVYCTNHTGPPVPFSTFGLKKITIPFGCWAKTPTHRFAAADDSLTRDGDDAYTVSYTWETPVADFTQGLNVTAFAELRNESLALSKQLDAMMSVQDAIAATEQARLNAPEDPTPIDSIKTSASNAVDGVANWTAERIHSLFGAPIVLLFQITMALGLGYLAFDHARRLNNLESRMPSYVSAQSQPLIIHAGASAPDPEPRMSYKDLLARA